LRLQLGGGAGHCSGHAARCVGHWDDDALGLVYKAFASSPDLKAAMENAGVKGTPQIWLTTRAEQRKRQR
jgi:hypothetical protein